MPVAIDLRGSRRGSLVAVEPAGRQATSRAILWLCRCDCGGTTTIPASTFRSGKTERCRSCYLAGCPTPRDVAVKRFLASLRPDGECVVWAGRRDVDGYGVLRFMGKAAKAHRVAYELANGPIPDGLGVLHSCDNPPCCNKAHLRAGTQAENVADMLSRGRGGHARGGQVVRARNTHCARGHEWTTENTIELHPSRSCRACQRDSARARRIRHAASVLSVGLDGETGDET